MIDAFPVDEAYIVSMFLGSVILLGWGFYGVYREKYRVIKRANDDRK